MTEVKFTRDYRGKLTREVFYPAGDVVAFEDSIASQIVAEQAAEYVLPTEEQPVEDAPKPKRKRKTTAKG